jgi:hypothetical protein
MSSCTWVHDEEIRELSSSDPAVLLDFRILQLVGTIWIFPGPALLSSPVMVNVMVESYTYFL